MENPSVKDDEELGAGWLPLACPEFQKGWRRFCATVLRQSLGLAHWLADFSERQNFNVHEKYRSKLQDKVANACSAWLWIFGEGSKDFTFADCAESCDLDPFELRQAFSALFECEADIKRVDHWVRRRCQLTGCLWDEDED